MARKQFSCDFETTTNPNDCRVWAWGYMQIGKISNYKIGNHLDDFMQWCEKVNGDLYFHNLKFDGSFIVNWLLKNGFTHDNSGLEKTFSTLISNTGQWYMIDICYGYKGKKKIHTCVYDSLKKLPFPVKQLAEAFKLDIMKGDIDYHLERPIGWEITEEERAYIKNDIEIVAKALEIQFNQGLTNMTNGSDSLSGFKDVFSTKLFEKHFPVLSLQMDTEIRKAYRGGFTWLNSKYVGVTICGGLVYDVNSLYPSVMYDCLLPYGMPVYFDGQYEENEDYPLYIQNVSFEFHIKENKIPTIQIKKSGRFVETEYLESSKGEIVNLSVTNIDLKLIEDHYHLIDVEYNGGWMFRAKRGIFNNFIDKWMHIKITSNGAIKALAKLMLNSLYGKFASNPNVTGKVPYLKDNGANGFMLGDEEFKDPIYTPMGVFITSYAREKTIRTAQSCYPRIIYCDTDSIHLEGDNEPESIKHLIDDDRLGFWQHESTFFRAKYIRQKTYIQEICQKEIDGRTVNAGLHDYTKLMLSVKCAGMPKQVKEKVTFENFQIGFRSNGKLVPKQVNGGVVLVDTEFTIK